MRVEYPGGAATVLRYGVTAVAILTAIAVTAVLWGRGLRAAVAAVASWACDRNDGVAKGVQQVTPLHPPPGSPTRCPPKA